jgi:hypothetical protein
MGPLPDRSSLDYSRRSVKMSLTSCLYQSDQLLISVWPAGWSRTRPSSFAACARTGTLVCDKISRQQVYLLCYFFRNKTGVVLIFHFLTHADKMNTRIPLTKKKHSKISRSFISSMCILLALQYGRIKWNGINGTSPILSAIGCLSERKMNASSLQWSIRRVTGDGRRDSSFPSVL